MTTLLYTSRGPEGTLSTSKGSVFLFVSRHAITSSAKQTFRLGCRYSIMFLNSFQVRRLARRQFPSIRCLLKAISGEFVYEYELHYLRSICICQMHMCNRNISGLTFLFVAVYHLDICEGVCVYCMWEHVRVCGSCTGAFLLSCCTSVYTHSSQKISRDSITTPQECKHMQRQPRANV